MTISKEAVEAAGNAIIDELTCRKGFRHVIDDLDEELLTDIKQDLGRESITAALPFLALRPAPSQSDEERAREFSLGWYGTDEKQAVHKVFVPRLAEAFATARAEATLAGAAAERRECAEACKGKKTALEAEAAIRARSL